MFASGSEDLDRGGSFADERTDGIGKIEDFEYSNSSLISRISAMFTPLAFIKFETCFFCLGDRLDSDIFHHPLNNI